jgi:two-component system phosphate regulon response regulator PhoB/two-component system alkaline phosphatase synthesis response regulator PhoP
MSLTSPQKILVMESNLEVQHLLLDRLSALGHECIIHDGVSSGIDTVVRIVPDLIILDVSGRGADSFVFLETLRAHTNPRIAKCPVIVASQNGDLVEIGRVLPFGVADYFVKSRLDPEKVMAKITKYLHPTAQTKSTESSPTPTPSPQSNKKAPKILIVEDDQFLRDLAAQKLRKEQLDVESAMDGERGITLAESIIPDVILLDILLPGIDGYEVLKRIRANPALQKTRIAMLSNFGQREDVDKALKSGADQFFVKANYTLDEIVEAVKKMLTNPRG